MATCQVLRLLLLAARCSRHAKQTPLAIESKHLFWLFPLVLDSNRTTLSVGLFETNGICDILFVKVDQHNK